MSLKLGNTNIAGTQVLYSTTGNNTDGAMTQNATTTQLNLKANDADVVHKTGNETINGVKTFIDNIQRNVNVIRGQTPATSSWNDINFVDNNGKWLAGFEYNLNTDKSSRLAIILSDSVSNTTNVKTSITLNLLANGTSYVESPASDVNNSIVTTVAKSKTQNGYFKLGNGMIVQWGRSNQRTFTYPIAFSSNTSFSIVVNNQAGTNGYGRPDSVDSLTSTSCTVTSLAEYPVRWIAIGY